MAHSPESQRETSQSFKTTRVNDAPDLTDQSSNNAIAAADKPINQSLADIYFANINDLGDTFTCNRKGQIVEFQYFGQQSPYKILQQDDKGNVTEFQCPNGTICTNFEGSWGTYDPETGKTRGMLSQTEVTIDDDGLHVSGRLGRDFLGLPLNAVQHETNERGDIFTLDESGTKINEFQYRGESGFYKVDSRRLNGDIYQITTPSGDFFHNQGSNYSPEWYRHFSRTVDPYEKIKESGPFYRVIVELTPDGLSTEARRMLDQ